MAEHGGDNDGNGLSEDERQIFRAAMAEVTPLETDRRSPDDAPRPEPEPAQRQADEAAVRAALASGELDDPDADPGEELFHARPGIQRRVLRRLRRGQYTMQAELDLHGLTRAEAGRELAAFLADCRNRGLTGIRIIHGKGRRSANDGPVLKPAVAGWLRRRSEVLAFCSARPVDGGSGALYVLLASRGGR
jgi:DNA-nicking Smr family endonuclease